METLSQKFETVDKFYVVLTFILVAMSILIIFSFRGVFSMFLTGYELDANMLNSSVRVEKEKISEAYDFVFTKNIIRLQQLPQTPIEPKKSEQ